jgi:hypothetical protein
MIHWIEDEDERGFAIWRRYVECSHWGLVLTRTLPRWFFPRWQAGAYRTDQFTRS